MISSLSASSSSSEPPRSFVPSTTPTRQRNDKHTTTPTLVSRVIVMGLSCFRAGRCSGSLVRSSRARQRAALFFRRSSIDVPLQALGVPQFKMIADAEQYQIRVEASHRAKLRRQSDAAGAVHGQASRLGEKESLGFRVERRG